MTTSITRRAALLLAASLSSMGISAQQPSAAAKPPQNWPTRPLRLVVGFPAGSIADLVARTIAEPLRVELGHPVVVENRIGAGGHIAADLVAKATDQHTIGILSSGHLALARLLNPASPFDPLKDFTPISLIASSPMVLVAPAGQTIPVGREFFEAARRSGKKWSYGSPGVGTMGQLSMELLKSRARMEAVHIPFPGNPQVVTAMLGGHVQLSLMPPSVAAAQVKAGKLLAIGVTSAGRSPLAPDLPSLEELGIPNYEVEVWMAAAAPASMPKSVVDRLSTLISEIARRPEIRGKLFQMGWRVEGTSPEGLANRIESDLKHFGSIISSQGTKSR